jgi:hypothetical protein
VLRNITVHVHVSASSPQEGVAHTIGSEANDGRVFVLLKP